MLICVCEHSGTSHAQTQVAMHVSSYKRRHTNTRTSKQTAITAGEGGAECATWLRDLDQSHQMPMYRSTQWGGGEMGPPCVYLNCTETQSVNMGCVGIKLGPSIDTIWKLTCIQNTLGQDGTKLGHDVIVLVVDHL